MIQRLSPDIISTLPQTIIEVILCLLSLEDAAMTSILSREWRYKWTTIPKLVFSGRYSASNIFCVVRQVMLLRNHPIQEFSLTVDNYDYTQSNMDQLLLYLSRNHAVTSLTLEFPTSCISLPLFVCNGFGSLTSLSLQLVTMHSETLLQFLSKCPSLKNFRLFMLEDNMVGHKRTTMVELFECLPVIERLPILYDTAQTLVPDLVLQELPTTLIHLKYICLEQLFYFDGKELIFIAALIKCSPNLEKIEIEFAPGFSFADTETNILEEYYSDVRLEHLTEFKYDCYNNFKLELELVKFVLARAPKLKKVSICCSRKVKKDQESEVLKTLLQIPRASPVKIDVSFLKLELLYD